MLQDLLLKAEPQEAAMKGDAFALAGLGGFNAHGAGFLAAAAKYKLVPDIVTSTSGQILIVADWLRGKDLRQSLIDPARENNPLAQLQTGLLGYPGVFRPAFRELIQRFWRLPAPTDSLVDIVADRLWPAQGYVSTRGEEFFENVASVLNNQACIDGKEVGVVFNTYDFATGQAVLYGNRHAQELLPSESALPQGRSTGDVRYARPGPSETDVQPITAEAVKAALWLSLYGFDDLPGGQMDGAYHRSCLVSELHEFSRIFVARPLANGWIGRRPGNWFEVQDWQFEMWFSVGYKAEVDALKRINQLIENGYLKHEKFKPVEIIEIEPSTPAGYFNYFIERDVVFDRAFEQAERVFRNLPPSRRHD
jgi:hypothetical protein